MIGQRTLEILSIGNAWFVNIKKIQKMQFTISYSLSDPKQKNIKFTKAANSHYIGKCIQLYKIV